MRRFLGTITLVCAVSMSTLAGNIPSDGQPQPPPQNNPSSTAPGDIPTSGEANEDGDLIGGLLALVDLVF